MPDRIMLYTFVIYCMIWVDCILYFSCLFLAWQGHYHEFLNSPLWTLRGSPGFIWHHNHWALCCWQSNYVPTALHTMSHLDPPSACPNIPTQTKFQCWDVTSVLLLLSLLLFPPTHQAPSQIPPPFTVAPGGFSLPCTHIATAGTIRLILPCASDFASFCSLFGFLFVCCLLSPRWETLRRQGLCFLVFPCLDLA